MSNQMQRSKVKDFTWHSCSIVYISNSLSVYNVADAPFMTGQLFYLYCTLFSHDDKIWQHCPTHRYIYTSSKCFNSNVGPVRYNKQRCPMQYCCVSWHAVSCHCKGHLSTNIGKFWQEVVNIIKITINSCPLTY